MNRIALPAVLAVCLLAASARAGEAIAPSGPEGRLALRVAELSPTSTPRVVEEPAAVLLPRMVAHVPAEAPLAQAQGRVLQDARRAGAWAALAGANYRSGRYDAAWAAARQMRSAAEELDIPLSIAAATLYEKCRRAAEALALTE